MRYESISYEGYAPAGVAVIVECLTDNRNRTGAEIRNVFNKNGGSMAEPGAVSWQFERKGSSPSPRPSTRTGSSRWPWRPGPRTWPTTGEHWTVTSAPADLMAVHAALEEAGAGAG